MIRTVAPLGDGALLADVGDTASAHRLARRLTDGTGGPPAGVGEVVIGARSVVVHLDPVSADPAEVERWLAGAAAGAGDGAATGTAGPGPRVELPVVFDGPDLDEVADRAGVSSAGIVDLLCAAELSVAFLGFSPGFPYLTGLPDELARLPRRSSPRTSVPAGSVAVAGGFAAVYPAPSPGGWMLLGRTGVPLFDATAPPYALLRPGDAVRFVAADGAVAGLPVGDGDHPGARVPTSRAPLRAATGRHVEVLEPGLLTLVQDGGRSGVAALGVPAGGAADPDALRLANRLVGNGDGAASLEITARGPTLRCSHDGHVAVVAEPAVPGGPGGRDAAEVLLDGRPVGAGTVVPVRAGQVLAVGAVRTGLRAYLAFAGGLEVPRLLGSMATDVLSGLGAGPLRSGDRVDVGAPGRPRGSLAAPQGPVGDGVRVVRVVPGPHALAPGELGRLVGTDWVVGDDSNRVGLRLAAAGDAVAVAAGVPGVPSCGMVTGAVQVPPHGRPIVLLPDHATVGGYPVAACVASVDLGALGRLRPGDRIRFEPVSRDDAVELRRRHERALAGRVGGWYPTGSGA